jgi:tetratricopeptide (TPR) repeat protein
MLGLNYEQKGMHEQARAEFEKAVKASNEDSNLVALLAAAHARSGNKSAAMAVLAKLQNQLKEKRAHSQDIAIIYAGLGERDRTFQWLERALQEHSSLILYLKTDPFFDSLRSDTRFSDLIRRAGLPS